MTSDIVFLTEMMPDTVIRFSGDVNIATPNTPLVVVEDKDVSIVPNEAIDVLVSRLSQITGHTWYRQSACDVLLSARLDDKQWTYCHPVMLMRLDADPEGYALMVVDDLNANLNHAAAWRYDTGVCVEHYTEKAKRTFCTRSRM